MKDVSIETAAAESPAVTKVRPSKERPQRAPKVWTAKASAPSKKAKNRKPATGVRTGTKTAKILAMLARPHGASLKEIVKATAWQPHSVRGFLSGVVSKQMGLTVRSNKDESGFLRYSAKP